MVNFVLNNLRRPAGVILHEGLLFHCLILYLDGLVALTTARSAEQREAALLRLVKSRFRYDNGV